MTSFNNHGRPVGDDNHDDGFMDEEEAAVENRLRDHEEVRDTKATMLKGSGDHDDDEWDGCESNEPFETGMPSPSGSQTARRQSRRFPPTTSRRSTTRSDHVSAASTRKSATTETPNDGCDRHVPVPLVLAEEAPPLSSVDPLRHDGHDEPGTSEKEGEASLLLANGSAQQPDSSEKESGGTLEDLFRNKHFPRVLAVILCEFVVVLVAIIVPIVLVLGRKNNNNSSNNTSQYTFRPTIPPTNAPSSVPPSINASLLEPNNITTAEETTVVFPTTSMSPTTSMPPSMAPSPAIGLFCNEFQRIYGPSCTCESDTIVYGGNLQMRDKITCTPVQRGGERKCLAIDDNKNVTITSALVKFEATSVLHELHYTILETAITNFHVFVSSPDIDRDTIDFRFSSIIGSDTRKTECALHNGGNHCTLCEICHVPQANIMATNTNPVHVTPHDIFHHGISANCPWTVLGTFDTCESGDSLATRLLWNGMATAVPGACPEVVAIPVVEAPPTPAPTTFPTTTVVPPSLAPTTGSFGDLMGFLETTIPATSLVDLQDPTSPQYMAARWMDESGFLDSIISTTTTRSGGVVEPRDGSSSSWLNDPRVLQLFALVTFYFATGGDNWKEGGQNAPTFAENDVAWLSNTEVCTWFSVGCVGGGVVGQIRFPLYLNGNNLIGTLPAELSLLTALKRFEAPDNALEGSLEVTFAGLSTLEVIDVSSNRLEGTLPMGILEPNRNLVTLDISDNRFFGMIPNDIGAVATKLSILHLGGNSFGGNIPSEIGTLSDLITLEMSGNRFLGSIPTEVFALTKLAMLSLEENQRLRGTIDPQISKLSKLAVLRLGGTTLGGTLPEELFEFTDLSEANVGGAYFSGSIPETISKLNGTLMDLILKDNRFTGRVPAALDHLTALEALEIQGNQLTGTITDAVCQQRGLRFQQLATLIVDCVVTCTCCDSCEDPKPPKEDPPAQTSSGKICLMVYQNADNARGSYILQQYEDIAASSAVSSENVRTWVYHDGFERLPDTVDGDGNPLSEDFSGSRYMTHNAELGKMQVEVELSGEQNSDTGESVLGFLNHALKDCLENGYDDLMLMFSGMGGGFAGFGGDESTRQRKLLMRNVETASAIRDALEANGPTKLDVLAFDGASMLGVAVVHDYKGVAKYFLGSEGVIPGLGFNYKESLTAGSSSSLELAEKLVWTSQYLARDQRMGHKTPKMMSLVDMTRYESFYDAFERLWAEALRVLQRGDGTLRSLISRSRSSAVSFSGVVDAAGEGIFPSSVDIGSWFERFGELCGPMSLASFSQDFLAAKRAYDGMFVSVGVGPGTQLGTGMSVTWPSQLEYRAHSALWETILFTHRIYFGGAIPNFREFLGYFISTPVPSAGIRGVSMCLNSRGRGDDSSSFELDVRRRHKFSASIPVSVSQVRFQYGIDVTTRLKSILEQVGDEPRDDDYLVLLGGDIRGRYGPGFCEGSFRGDYFLLEIDDGSAKQEEWLYVLDFGNDARRIPAYYFPHANDHGEPFIYLERLDTREFKRDVWLARGARPAFLTFSVNDVHSDRVNDNLSLFAGGTSGAMSEVPRSNGGFVVPLIYVEGRIQGRKMTVLPGGLNQTIFPWTEESGVRVVKFGFSELYERVPSADAEIVTATAWTFVDAVRDTSEVLYHEVSRVRGSGLDTRAGNR